jgi:hypothetical protein
VTGAAIDAEGELLGDDSVDTVDIDVESRVTVTLDVDVDGTAVILDLL